LIEWNNRWLIAGVSGTGKTWLALWIISQYVRLRKRSFYVFLTDNARDYNKTNHTPAIRPAANGFQLVTYTNEHATRAWNWEKVLRKHNRLYIETANLLEDEMKVLVNSLSKAFWRLGSGLFAVDEAWQFLSHTNPPLEFERLSRGGRKVGVDVMAITQRVVDIHPRILNSLNVIVSFRLTEKNDVERVSRYFEPVKGKDPRVVIPKMKQGQYVIKVTETGEQEMNSTLGLR
jgi:KaiC/GvpD/RAD55 family RecA-like ATPase